MMDSNDAVKFFNRYTGRVETEDIYGEAWLRWTYENPGGRLLLWAVAKRLWFSHWYGWRMDRPGSHKKVVPFCETYGLDTSEFEKPGENFDSFNDFFSRRLKSTARPMDPDPDAAIFPVDGRHLGFQDISEAEGVFVKGQKFDLPALLGDAALAGQYREGSLVISRLCPVDYHRYHFPVSGIPGNPRLVNGFLFSVNPIALRRRLNVLWENKRCLTILETERFGKILTVEVGATCVGSIRQTFSPEKPVLKGAEKGYFRFGGSMVLTFFEKGRIRLDEDLLENSRQGLELYARLSDRMGIATAQGPGDAGN